MDFKTDNTQRSQLIALAGLNFLEKNGEFLVLTIENGLLFAIHSEKGLSKINTYYKI